MKTQYKSFISALLTTAIMLTSVSAVFADKISSSVNGNDIVVKEGSNVLVKDLDYILEYKDNVQVGTATVTIRFIGNYSGKEEQTFNIVKKSSGGSPIGSGGSGGGGGSHNPEQNKTNVTVTDKNDNPINVTKKDDDDKVIITLPVDKEISDDNPVTIKVTDKKDNPIETEVVLKDKKGNEVTGKTDKDGKLTLPQTAEVSPSPAPTKEPENYEHCAYINGYEDGTFAPDSNITRAETASMLSNIIQLNGTSSPLTFSDIVTGAWYIPAINKMSSAGIIKGYDDNTFKPDNKITRAEFVAMLMRNEKVQKFTSLPFSDISSGLWSADYIYSAYKSGYIDGYEDGTFKPDNLITRAEAVKMINAALSRTDLTNATNPFPDVKNTHWAYKDILEAAVNHNISK